MGTEAEGIVICELRCTCTPGGQPIDSGSTGWRTSRFETIDGLSGTVIWSQAGDESRSVYIALSHAGRYAVCLGLWNPAQVPHSALQVQMPGQPYPRRIINDADYLCIREVPWGTATLTGEPLRLTSIPGERGGLAYVRLRPAARLPSSAASTARTLVAILDGYFFHEPGPAGADYFRAKIEPFRDTDFGTLLWGLGPGGDVVHYRTNVGVTFGEGVAEFPGSLERASARRLHALLDQGIDPLAVAVEHAHDCGLRIQASVRLGAFGLNPPFDCFEGRLVLEHPELRCVHRDGDFVARMSFAYPEVRNHVIDLLIEAVAHGFDGVNLNLVRAAPYVLYEPPVIQRFADKYGLDPRSIPADDPRWLGTRADFLTEFVRECRDRVLRETGRGLDFSAVVYSDEATNRRFGLDVATWVREGLVQMVVPYYRAVYCDGPVDMDHFASLAEGTPCRICPDLEKSLTAEQYGPAAEAFYRAGAHGLACWDALGRCERLDRWSFLRRLGHMETVSDVLQEQSPVQDRPLRAVGGYRVDACPAWWAY